VLSLSLSLAAIDRSGFPSFLASEDNNLLELDFLDFSVSGLALLELENRW
jgi:hypothetical protein